MSELDKQINELRRIIEEQNKKIEKQQKRIDTQAERIDELENDCALNTSRINGITRSLDSIEDEIKKVDVGSSDIELSPIEEAVVYYDNPEQCTVINKMSAARAARIVKKFPDWSVKNKGDSRRLSVKEDSLINLYESEYGEKLQSTQFRRAFEAAANLSRGKLELRKEGGNELHLLPGKELITTKKDLEEKN